MKTRLVGVHRVKARLADGTIVEYFYAWRGGPRMASKPGTTAFLHEFTRLTKERPPSKEVAESIAWLIGEYKKSADYQNLKATTKSDYDRSLGILRATFGTLSVPAAEAKGSRKVFLDWRDTMVSTPRAADLHIVVFAKVFSWAKDKEIMLRNPLERVTKLYKGGNRKDAIWMPSQLTKLLVEGHPHIADTVRMALWTMQRQADLLTLPVTAYDDGRLWIVQGKTGARVKIRPADEILPILERAKAKKQQRILVNSFGDNWTSSGFRSSFRKEQARLGIKGVTFHDLRGTGISFAYAHGMDVKRIAEISGHSPAECEAIIRRHYLAGSDVIEAIRAGTKL